MQTEKVIRKKQSVAGILWLFMLHRFYLGRYISGLLQIFTAGGCLVWWFYDAYNIFTGKMTDKNGIEID